MHRSNTSSGLGRIPFAKLVGSPARPTHSPPERATSSTSRWEGREVNRGGRPEGPEFTYSAQFRDIVIDQRIVHTYEILADDSRISVTVATIEFHGSNGATQLALTEQGVFLAGHDTVAQREAGTRSLLDSLATFLAAEER
jgi:uncharacterized protein YndB with AHSA1/START domain